MRDNPWAASVVRMSDEELEDVLAAVRLVAAEIGDADDEASQAAREVARLMEEAARRELVLRRRAGVRLRLDTGGLPRERVRQLREEIRRKVDLVWLIGQDAPLRKCGSSWRAACPLCRARNTTTLTIWPASGRWVCWRCGMCGDAVSWLMATRPQLDFRATLTHAAMLAGIPIDQAVRWPGERG
jgi:hypothetical protein